MGRLDLITQEAAEIQPPLMQLLFAQMNIAFKSLVELTKDMTVPELDYRGPTGDRNNTAMLINHLALTDAWWLYAFQREAIPTELIELFGPWMDQNGRIPVVRGERVNEILEAYSRVHGMVQAYSRTLRDEDLLNSVPTGGGSEVTIRWALWHMTEHSVWHQGQITWLKSWVRSSRAPTIMDPGGR